MSPTPAMLLAALTALAVGLEACASPAARVSASCTPAFPYRDGWLGADAAYSIPLSSAETLWLFGDTFVGEPGQSSRRGARFIHNSIGLSRCDAEGVWSMEYHWGQGRAGPKAFLDRGQTGKWWWLFDGFVHGGQLYLGLLEVETTGPRGPLDMPFGYTGVDLGRVVNYRDPVGEWRLERQRLSRGDVALPAGAMVVHEDHVYFFTFLDRNAQSYPRILVRLPLVALDSGNRDLEPALETLMEDGSWGAGLVPDGARVVMADDATEMSVHYHAAIDQWLALYSFPTLEGAAGQQRPADKVWVRTADSLEGPWSERRSLFRIPELDPSYAGGYDPSTACYAAKEHPQISPSRSVSFTYVCNLFAGLDGDPGEVLGRLLDDMGLYRPIPVTVTLPPELSGEE